MRELAEFLLARIADDEKAARNARWCDRPGYGGGQDYETVSDCDCGDDHAASSYLAVDPARVLAECEAKRRIVEAAQEALAEHQIGTAKWLRVLDALALPYRDHPLYPARKTY